MTGKIRAGIGGWTFEAWRGVFYPRGLRQADELAFASRCLTAIEINTTYYSTYKPESFARWAAQTPEDFVFAVKASRFCTNRKVLKDGAGSIERFLGQGLVELGGRLGPLLWQFMPTKRFDRDDIATFLDLLPAKLGGLVLRHCVEVRHESFADPRFVELCRERGVAICCSDNDAYPMIADVTADFVYARLIRGDDRIRTGYRPADLDAWAARFSAWSHGDAPGDLPTVLPDRPARSAGRDAFAFFIHAGKVRAPAAALALLKRVKA